MKAVTPLLLVVVVSLLVGSASSQTLQVWLQLNLPSQTGQWLSTSVYGTVYSFLSTTALWWGPVSETTMNVNGQPLPIRLDDAVVLVEGYSYNPQTGHTGVAFVMYFPEEGVNNLAFVFLDVTTRQFVISGQLSPPVDTNPNWQVLVSNSEDAAQRNLYFLVAPNHVLSAKFANSSFTQVTMLPIPKSAYAMVNVTSAIYYKGHLFIASAGLDSNSNPVSEIVYLTVDTNSTAPSYGSLTYNSVKSLQTYCYNLFGMGNYVLWQTVENGKGVVYAWDFANDVLTHNAEATFPQGTVWGSAYGVFNPKGQALLVAGDPTSNKGYTAYAYTFRRKSLALLGQLAVTNGDAMPQLGMQVEDASGLYVALLGHNATGAGKITVMRYF